MANDEKGSHRETLAAQGMGRVADTYRDIVPPIHVATTYERGADGAYPGGRVYSRADNPSYDQAEALVAALEGAAAAMLFASGQAAAAAVFQALAPGDCVLAPRNMYWALRKWLLEFAAPWGLASSSTRTRRSTISRRRPAQRRPSLIWIETPANPTWDITDIAAASEIAREVGAIVAVDSTAATPMLTRPIELGAQIVMHSATKYLNGHSDVIAGALASRAGRRVLAAHPLRARRRRRRAGAVRGVAAAARHAHAASARRRGLRERARDRAAPARPPEALARALSGLADASGTRRRREADARRIRRDDVAAPCRRRGRRDRIRGEASRVQARDVAGVGREPGRASRQRRRPGTLCPTDLVRLSIGVEHVDDLIADIEQALG